MALVIPTTQELVDRILSFLESRLNQTAPLNDKAFLRVIAAMEAMNYTELYKFGADRAKQNLALTATDEALERIGLNYGVERTPAQTAIMEMEVTNPDPVITAIVNNGDIWRGDPNGVRYAQNSDLFIAPSTSEKVYITALEAGADGNLQISDTLTKENSNTVIDNVAVITEVDPLQDSNLRLGTDREEIEDYRRRVLFEIRTVGGGGNGVDYRTWSEGVPCVFRTFPYTGPPLIPIPTFSDGDMEDPTTAAWTPINSATLTKETATPFEGTRYLRVTRNGVNLPAAGQTSLTVGRYYRIQGVARGNGTWFPLLLNGLTQFIFVGSASTTWQPFDIMFIASNTDIVLMGYVLSGTGFVEFDDITITNEIVPGARTVYVEADSSIDPDGIAPPTMLADVRSAINFDPDTGVQRPPLGFTDETLYVETISRTPFYVEIRDLQVEASIESQVKAQIDAAITDYFLSITPYLEGIDPATTKDDTITDLTLSRVVQDILDPVGGSAAGIGFGLQAGVFIASYTLGMGELAKVVSITYV